MTQNSTSTFTIDRAALTILLSTVAKFAGKTTPYNLADLVFEKRPTIRELLQWRGRDQGYRCRKRRRERRAESHLWGER